jgi:hypothetical protein
MFTGPRLELRRASMETHLDRGVLQGCAELHLNLMMTGMGRGLRGLASECKSRCIPCSIFYIERQPYANWLFTLFEHPIICASAFLSTQRLIHLNYRHDKDTSSDPDTGSRAMMVVVGESAWLAKAVDALTSVNIFPVHVQINHMAPIVPSPPAVASS